MMNQQIFAGSRFIVLTGNYGSGKTEIALNLALGYAESGQKTTLVDLDIVNPYFRSGEKKAETEAAGIRMLMPTYALTTVDIPALPPEIQSVFDIPSDRVVFDVGGDDTGAAALGRYHPAFDARKDVTRMALVINCMRPLTQDEEDIIDLAERISSRSRMRIDLLINNTNLADQTTAEMVEAGERIVRSCAERMGILSVVTAAKPEILKQITTELPCLPVRRYMAPEWMEEL